MPSLSHRRLALALLASTAALAIAGCPAPVDFADTLDVATTASDKVTAARDSGPPRLAGTTWAVYRSPDPSDAQINAGPSTSPYGATLGGRNILPRLAPDVVMARIEFDADGRALRLFDNAFYTPELLGPEFILDARTHPTPTPLLSYVTESYGVSIGNRFGFASPITVLAGGLPAGRGIAYAWGTVEGDRLTGQFGYQVEVYLPGTVFGDGAADQYAFYGLRE